MDELLADFEKKVEEAKTNYAYARKTAPATGYETEAKRELKTWEQARDKVKAAKEKRSGPTPDKDSPNTSCR